jgi:hypothetical protein
VLIQQGLNGPLKTSVGNYDITFDLQPYPEVNKTTDKKEYKLLLVVKRKPKSPLVLTTEK